MFLITRTVLYLLCTHIHVSSRTSAPTAFGHAASPSLHGASCVPHLSPSLHGAACVHASQSVSSYLHGASCVQASQSVSTLHCMQPVCTHLRWFLKLKYVFDYTHGFISSAYIHVSSQTSAPAAFGHAATCLPPSTPRQHRR